nr:AAA domain-containing protein [Mycoplasma phocoeninasale]
MVEDFDNNYEIYENNKQKFLEEFIDKRWEIIDAIELSNFSFSKISIYKDIEENLDKIEENSFYKALAGESSIANNALNINENNVEDHINHEQYYHVLSSDSSQEVAIESAIKGKSFVLQGPPGTGKSQTITNIITELIARGKKVLFVAEKKAALDVVYNKLKEIELEDYTIPIHNSAIDKKLILQNLYETLEKGRNKYIISGEKEILDQYKTNYDFLKKYGEELLKIRKPINKNVYQLIGKFLQYKNKDDLNFNINNIEHIDELKLNEIKIKINSYFQTMKLLNFNPQKNNWYGLKGTYLSIQQKEEIHKIINTLIEKINNINYDSDLLNLSSFSNKNSIEDTKKLYDLIAFSLEIEHVDEKLEDKYHIESDLLNYKKILKIKEDIDILEDDIFARYQNNIVGEDLNFIESSLLHVKDKKIKIFNKNFRLAKKIFKKYSLKNKFDFNNYLSDIKRIKELNENYKNFISFENLIVTKIHDNQTVDNLRKVVQQFELINMLGNLKLNTGIDLDRKTLFAKINNGQNSDNFLKNIEIKLKELLDINAKFINFFNHKNDDFELSDLKDKCFKLQDGFNEIDSILEYNRDLEKLEAENLMDYEYQIRANNLVNDYYDIFLKRFYKLLIDKYLSSNFYNYSASSLNNYYKSFIEYDDKISALAKTKIDSKLKNQIPNMDGLLADNQEIKLLKSQINKSRKIMPFRLLFQKISRLIMQLKPCLMMSPLSVSTYLKNADIEFDVVIFDEASQVKPENAIGAIYRSKQFIIVGDKEQLPPTNFFNSVDKDDDIYDEEDESNELKGFDSILELADSNLDSIKLK